MSVFSHHKQLGVGKAGEKGTFCGNLCFFSLVETTWRTDDLKR